LAHHKSNANLLMNFADDRSAMLLALDWAAKAMHNTTPNPRVGAVLVQDGKLLGAGHTLAPGQAHAEIEALRDARERGHGAHGATLYVTLEPCNHFGRTPPCTDAIIAAGIAIRDPNPLVAGHGLEKLRAAGIVVETGLLQTEARELNIGFFSRMERGLPWVRMKAAASLDGKTALFSGKSQWITSQEARDDGHRWRARACAIVTGIGTVKQDDPQMTVRAIETPRQPQRVVIDSKLEINPAAKILRGGAWVFAAVHDAEKEARLRAQGVEVIVLPNANGKVDLPEMLRELGRRQINEVHGEAGAKLNGSLIREACVDELLLYVAPSVLGDGMGLFDLPAPASLQQLRQLYFHEVSRIGADLRILARFAHHASVSST
jgi:diaminohydroxyphosphoribosylaminopyrimidine deaminase / 5-amino-6-(5-phosphoribosylamino)uracil reductase